MGIEGGPSEKDMGLKPEETRVLSDAELIKGGARLKEGGRLEVTSEQVQQASEEMTYELDIKKAREIVKQLKSRSREGELGKEDIALIQDLRRIIGTDPSSRTYRISPKKIGLNTHSDIDSWELTARQAEAMRKKKIEEAIRRGR